MLGTLCTVTLSGGIFHLWCHQGQHQLTKCESKSEESQTSLAEHDTPGLGVHERCLLVKQICRLKKGNKPTEKNHDLSTQLFQLANTSSDRKCFRFAQITAVSIKLLIVIPEVQFEVHYENLSDTLKRPYLDFLACKLHSTKQQCEKKLAFARKWRFSTEHGTQ